MSGFTINSVVISGNMTRDPELRALPSGTSVCQISVAVNERVKDGYGNYEDRPSYFDVTIFGKIGEWIANNTAKGDGITVEGRLRQDRWEKDGQKRSAVKIIANSVVPRGESRGRQQQQQGFQPRSDIPTDFGVPGQQPAQPVPGGGYGVPGQQQAPAPPPQPQPVPAVDDDIPF